MKIFDVVALGEILIDMTYAGTSEAGQTLFEQNPGGAPANVVAAVQRLGGKTAFIGKVGDDMHGAFLRRTLEKENISTEGLLTDGSVFTTLAFVNIDRNGDRRFSFARKPGADTCLCREEINTSLIANSKIFHIGSLSLTDEPAKTATLFALETAKKSGCIISYDPNYRPLLWKSEQQAVSRMRSILPHADIVKLSDEETRLLTGWEKPEDASRALLDAGASIAIITKGSHGAHIRTKSGCVESAALSVKAVDTTGAGDAFLGAFLWHCANSGKECAELTLAEIQNFADFSNQVSGFCVQRRGAINAMPYRNQLSLSQ